MITFNNQAKLAQFYSIQPYLTFVLGLETGSEVFSSIYTALDKQPRILSISNFQESNQGGLDYSTSLDVELSDYDGTLKDAFDSGSLIDKDCQIVQNFNDVELEDVLFTGRITTPITWDESRRVLSFTMENKVQDVMINDAEPIDDCDMEYIPMCYGEVLGVPATRGTGCKKVSKLLKKIESFCTVSQSGKITYESGNLFIKNGKTIFGDQTISLLVAGVKFTGAFLYPWDETYFVLGTGGFNEAFRVGGILINPRDAVTDDNDYLNPTLAWISEEDHSILNKYIRLSYETEYWYSLDPDDNRCPATENTPDAVKVKELNYTCVVASGLEGQKLQIDNAVLDTFNRPVLLGHKLKSKILEIKGQIDYKWSGCPTYNYPQRWEIPAGTEVTLYSSDEVWYANQFASQSVVNVYGLKNGKMSALPPTWYEVSLTGPTTITLIKSLLSLGGFDSDQIFVDLKSFVDSDNIAAVIKFLAENYCTDLDVDTDSYNSAYSDLSTLPCGFARFQPERSFDLMKILAYHGGLGLVIYNGTLYFKNLVTTPTGTADYELTKTKTEFQSVRITTNAESEVITHFIGKYRESYYPSDEEHTIIRRSDNKDNFKKNVYDYSFDCFNQKDCVIRVMEFYLSRMSDLWQIFSAKTFLTSLNMFVNDKVKLTNIYSAATFGIIRSKNYDPIDHSVTLEIETDKSLFGHTFWGSLAGTTPASILVVNDIDSDQVFDRLGTYPIVSLLPTKMFPFDGYKDPNTMDKTIVDVSRDSAVLKGRVKTIYDTYLEVELVDPYDPSKLRNWNNESPVNVLPAGQLPETTIYVAKAKKQTGY